MQQETEQRVDHEVITQRSYVTRLRKTASKEVGCRKGESSSIWLDEEGSTRSKFKEEVYVQAWLKLNKSVRCKLLINI